MLQFKFKGALMAGSPLTQGSQSFVVFIWSSRVLLFRPYSDYMKPTYNMEGNLFYSRFNVNSNIILKIHHRNILVHI